MAAATKYEIEVKAEARAALKKLPPDACREIGCRLHILLTKNPLFQWVAEAFATKHRFAELEVPTVIVEGLIILKLCALPPLYRMFDLDRAILFETDIALLIARHSPKQETLTELLAGRMEAGDQLKLSQILSECYERTKSVRERAERMSA